MHNNAAPPMKEPEAEILQGDCLTILQGYAADAFDLIVTSPPCARDLLGVDSLTVRGGPVADHLKRKSILKL
jgi:hypothetical protein